MESWVRNERKGIEKVPGIGQFLQEPGIFLRLITSRCRLIGVDLLTLAAAVPHFVPYEQIENH